MQTWVSFVCQLTPYRSGCAAKFSMLKRLTEALAEDREKMNVKTKQKISQRMCFPTAVRSSL